jgi:quercetin dioxygenase-like cupin family protein
MGSLFLHGDCLNTDFYFNDYLYSLSKTFHMFHTFHQSIPTPTHINHQETHSRIFESSSLLRM